MWHARIRKVYVEFRFRIHNIFIHYTTSFLNKKVNLVSIEKLKVENNQELEQMITNEINKVEKDLTVIRSNQFFFPAFLDSKLNIMRNASGDVFT